MTGALRYELLTERSLLERHSHFINCRFASAVFCDLLERSAAACRNLTDQAEIAALQLTRRQLLGGDAGTAAALDRSRRCTCSSGGRGRGDRCWLASASRRTARTAATSGWTATAGSCRCARRSSGVRAQRLQTRLEITDLTMHIADAPIHFCGGDPPFGNQPFQYIGGLSGGQRGG